MSACLDHKVLPVRQEPLVLPVSRDHRVRMDSLEHKEPREHLVFQVPQDHGVIQDQKVLQAKWVSQVHRDLKVIQAALDHPDNLDQRVPLGIKDKLETQGR